MLNAEITLRAAIDGVTEPIEDLLARLEGLQARTAAHFAQTGVARPNDEEAERVETGCERAV